MQEYGGYIEFEYYHGKVYHEKAIALNSGRHCVEYLIRAKKIRKLYMPYFMCNSVSMSCKKLGVDVEYYHTGVDFLPLFNRTLEEGEWLYLVNYYGQISDASLSEWKKYERIIVDHAQDFFRKPLDGVDCCYTCRKFFGVADGGYLYTDVQLKEDLQQDYSYDKMEYLLGRLEKGASDFYTDNVANNKRFAEESLKRMSRITTNLLRGINYTQVERIRTENFAFLHDRLSQVNRLHLTIPSGAFMYPLYIENGSEVRRKLQQQKIYIPTLWPDVFERCQENSLEYDMAKNIVPLPVDQRYGIEDISYIYQRLMDTI